MSQHLPLIPLPAPLKLKGALGYVIHNAVAGDMVHRPLAADPYLAGSPMMTPSSSTSQSFLGFFGPQGDFDAIIVGPHDGARRPFKNSGGSVGMGMLASVPHGRRNSSPTPTILPTFPDHTDQCVAVPSMSGKLCGSMRAIRAKESGRNACGSRKVRDTSG